MAWTWQSNFCGACPFYELSFSNCYTNLLVTLLFMHCPSYARDLVIWFKSGPKWLFSSQGYVLIMLRPWEYTGAVCCHHIWMAATTLTPIRAVVLAFIVDFVASVLVAESILLFIEIRESDWGWITSRRETIDDTICWGMKADKKLYSQSRKKCLLTI